MNSKQQHRLSDAKQVERQDAAFASCDALAETDVIRPLCGGPNQESPGEGNEVAQLSRREPQKDAEVTWDSLLADLKRLSKRANAGDRDAVAEIRRLLDDYPDLVEHLWRLSDRAVDAWLDVLVGPDHVARELTTRQLAAIKGNLAGESATQLEKLLIENIGITYLALLHATTSDAKDTRGSFMESAAAIKRVESAQRRHLAAIKALATLRAKLPAGLMPIRGLRLHNPEQEPGGQSRKHA